MPDQTDDIRQVLERLQQGGPEALEGLFSENRERLRRMVDFRLDVRLRGRVATSDVLQEAYIDALKRLPHYQENPAVPFFIWLRTVTIQRLIEVHRRHIGAKARNAAREVSLGPVGGIDASSDRQALDRLDPIDREVLALRHFEELSNHETAVLLEINPPAASKRYVRALERLKDALEQSPGFGEDS
jgi:RNA polymerase sigma-70 factor (ECF subfamily)